MKNLSAYRNHTIKNSKQLERHFKGIANYHRIEMLTLVNKRPGLTLDQITEELNCNYQTLAEHAARLVRAGLITKKNKANNVEHAVTKCGKEICEFINNFRWD